jgi:hypothetical protein
MIAFSRSATLLKTPRRIHCSVISMGDLGEEALDQLEPGGGVGVKSRWKRGYAASPVENVSRGERLGVIPVLNLALRDTSGAPASGHFFFFFSFFGVSSCEVAEAFTAACSFFVSSSPDSPLPAIFDTRDLAVSFFGIEIPPVEGPTHSDGDLGSNFDRCIFLTNRAR